MGDDGKPQIAHGVAEDRLISWTDPQMRHGRKSSTGCWDGAKVQVAENLTSALITGVEIVAANTGDGASLLDLVTDVQGHQRVEVVEVIGDTAYGDTENRVECAARGIDLIAPVPSSGEATNPKDDFRVGEDGANLACPHGQTTAGWRWPADER